MNVYDEIWSQRLWDISWVSISGLMDCRWRGEWRVPTAVYGLQGHETVSSLTFKVTILGRTILVFDGNRKA